MIVSERDAKLKLCCGPAGCGESDITNNERRLCVASRCMAWAWGLETNENDLYIDISNEYGRCGYVRNNYER